MDLTSSQFFVAKLRAVLEEVTSLVAKSHRIGLAIDNEWPESEFFSALITQGFRGEHPRTRRLLTELSKFGPFEFRIESVRHNQQKMEPLTGADLAVAITFAIDGADFARRGFLVQLKKAKLGAKKFSFAVESLHHKSGASVFGTNLHQAERMLIFTQAAVYWVAVPPNAVHDKSLMQHYLSATSLAARRKRRTESATMHAPPQGDGYLSTWPILSIDHPEFDRFLHRWEHYVGSHSGQSIKDAAKQKQELQKENILRDLRSDAAAESRRSFGMGSLLSVLAIHADSILALSNTSTTDIAQLYGHSVSLPEFFLGDVIADSFGDDNSELTEAILQNKPNDYVLDTIRSRAPDLSPNRDAPIARDALSIRVAMKTRPQGDA